MRVIYIFWISFMLIVLNQSVIHAGEANKDASALHILYYDNIEFEEDPYEFLNGLPLDDFKKHLEFLTSNSFNVIDLGDLSSTKNVKAEKNVAIIFNAADNETIAHAMPLMKKHQYPFHFTSDTTNRAFRNNKNINFQQIFLNIKETSEEIDFTQKTTNDETSRFRDLFGYTPVYLFLKDMALYLEHKHLFNKYDFKKTFIPTNEANSLNASDPIYSYINVQPSFSNLDVLETYLNRRPFHYKNLNTNKYDDIKNKLIKISWGMTLENISAMEANSIECVSSDGTKADVFLIDNRLEIRHDRKKQ